MNDRRREAQQRLVAHAALQRQREAEKAKLDRYVKAVFKSHAGEVLHSRDGRRYQVQDDGSLRRVTVEEGGTP